MYFNIKYIKLHCTNRARFLPTICHRIALRETCMAFGNHLSSDKRYATLTRFLFLLQFVVWLSTQNTSLLLIQMAPDLSPISEFANLATIY